MAASSVVMVILLEIIPILPLRDAEMRTKYFCGSGQRCMSREYFPSGSVPGVLLNVDGKAVGMRVERRLSGTL